MEEDPYVSIIKFCYPTASQEAKFPNCPLARESDNFADSNLDLLSSSPDPTPSDPTGIVMVSPPCSSNSVHQHVEEEAIFHTPPEQHAHSHLSSSEDQNPHELCIGGVDAGVDAVDGPDKRKKPRVSEAGLDDEPEAKRISVMEEKFDGETVPVGETAGLDDEPEAKRIRVMEEKFDGETVPVGETEAIEMEGDEGVHDTEVVVLDGADSGEEMATVNLGEDSLDITCEVGVDVGTVDVVQKISIAKVDAINGNHELGKNCESLEEARENKGEKSNENSDLSGSLDSDKIEDAIVKLKCIVGNRCIEVRRKSGVGGSEKVVKITKEAKMTEDCYRNRGPVTDGKRIEEIGETDGKRIEEIGLETDGKRIGEIGLKTDGKRSEEIGLKTNGKRIEDIDEFRFTGDVDSRWKGRTGRAVCGSSRRRQLPVSLKGKEKDVVETVETKSGLLDFLDVLKGVVGDRDDGCEDVDFLETAKRRGLTFPKARWWPSEGDDEGRAL